MKKTLASQVQAFLDWKGEGYGPAQLAADVARYQSNLPANKRCKRQNIEQLIEKSIDAPRYLVELAQAMGTSAEDLRQGRFIPGGEIERFGGGKVLALHEEEAIPEDVVQIPEYRLKFSGGNGSVAVEYELVGESMPATYRLAWMQREQLNPKSLARFKVTGESMEPVLFKGDSVLVNLADNQIDTIIDGKVYAIRYENELRIKRLYRRLGGALTLRSYNPDYKDEDLTAEQVQQHITIIGRVRDKSGSGGL